MIKKGSEGVGGHAVPLPSLKGGVRGAQCLAPTVPLI